MEIELGSEVISGPVFFPFGPIAGLVVDFIHISYRDSHKKCFYVCEND